MTTTVRATTEKTPKIMKMPPMPIPCSAVRKLMATRRLQAHPRITPSVATLA
jgi:hypothetical protein